MPSIVSRCIRLLLVTAICLLFVPTLAAAPSQEAVSPPPASVSAPGGVLPEAPDASVTTATDAVKRKIQPELQAQAAVSDADSAVAVLVVAAPGDEDFSRYGRVIADKTFSELGIRQVLMSLPAGMLTKLASLPAVAALSGYRTNAAPDVADPDVPGARQAGIAKSPVPLRTDGVSARQGARAVSAAAAEPAGTATPYAEPRPELAITPDGASAGIDSWVENFIQGVYETWTYLDIYGTGDPGNNLKIAVIDTGCDFCTPALMGRYAVENAGSVYDGWPIAYDDYSAYQFLLNYPDAGMHDGGNWGWYVNASRTTGEGTFVDELYDNVMHTPGTSVSGIYRYGYHPDSLWHYYGASAVVLLVADTVTAGVYDTVYIDGDWDGYYGGPGDATLTISNPVGCIDWVSPAGSTPDGVPDDSFGMLYWISDGVNPLPGVESIYGPGTPVPASGQVLMFMINDAMLAGGDHGTLVASSAAGYDNRAYRDWDNLLAFTPPFRFSIVQGPASGGEYASPSEGARIIAMGNYYQGGSSVANYNFLVFGYDGIADGVDDAQIANMSYGNGSEDADAWDFESEYLAFLNLITEESGLASPLLTVSSGNGGHGYGTVNSPAPATALQVGASTQYGPYNLWGAYEGVSVPERSAMQDVQPWSGRGPTAMSTLAPHVVANGAWGSGALPINLATYYGGYGGDGSTAWDVWGGTSRSAPVAAGVAALVYDAYYMKWGTYPTWRVARQLIMNGAIDLHYDEKVAGAGQVNPYETIRRIWFYGSGVEVDPAFYQAGDHLPTGGRYDSSAVGLYPGMVDTTVLTFTNNSSYTQTLRLTDEQLQLVGSATFTIASPGNEPISNYSSGAPNYAVKLNDLIMQHAGADLMVVRVMQPFENFDQAPLPPTPGATSFANRWFGLLYKVYDDGDGIWWDDKNMNGQVNLTTVLELDTDDEYIRTTYSYAKGTMQEMRMNDTTETLLGLEKEWSHAADIWLGLAKRNSDGRPTELTVQVLFYLENDWDQVSVEPGYLQLPAAADSWTPAIATATLTVAAFSAVPELVENFDDLTYMGWAPDGLWHPSVDAVNACVPAYSAPGAIGFFRDGDCDYDTGAPVSGTLMRFVPLSVPVAPVVQLGFMSLEMTENAGVAGSNDIRALQVSTDMMEWVTLWDSTYGSLENTWYERKVDITGYSGQQIYIRFLFDSVTDEFNDFGGWYIDDIRLLVSSGEDTYGEHMGRVIARSLEDDVVTVVPVEKQVWAYLGEEPVVLGGKYPANTPYDNSAQFGAMDWGGRSEAGDWRFYPYVVPAAVAAGTQVLAHAAWEDYPTDIDSLFFQPVTPWLNYPQFFGPSTLDYLGAGSARVGSRPNWQFYNNTAGYTGTETEEFVTAPAVEGLNMLAQQAVLYGGHQGAAPVTTTLGTAVLSPNLLQVPGLACAGCELPVTFSANLDLPEGLVSGGAFGWYQPQMIFGEITQNESKVYSLVLANTFRLKLVLSEVYGAPDLDLYLYRDNGNGVWDAGDPMVALSGGADSNELISVQAPADGLYWVEVYGYAVTGSPGQFILDTWNISGLGAITLLDTPASVTAGEVYTMHVRFDAAPPTPGNWQGLVLFGPAGAPTAFELPVEVFQAEASLSVSSAVAKPGDLLTLTAVLTVPAGSPPAPIQIKVPVPDGTEFVSVAGAAMEGDPAYAWWQGSDKFHTVALTVRVTASPPFTVTGQASIGTTTNVGLLWCGYWSETVIYTGHELAIPLVLKNYAP